MLAGVAQRGSGAQLPLTPDFFVSTPVFCGENVLASDYSRWPAVSAKSTVLPLDIFLFHAHAIEHCASSRYLRSRLFFSHAVTVCLPCRRNHASRR